MATRKGFVVRWTFPDETTFMPHEELALQWLQETARMFCSENEEHRHRAQERLVIASRMLAASEAEKFVNRINASGSKVDETERKRIVAFYAKRVADGRVPGAMKDLEAKFGYSAPTLNSILYEAGLKKRKPK